MTIRKWVFSCLLIVFAILLVFGGTTFVLDPLVRYRTEYDGVLSYYPHDEMYSNPGIAMNYEYDTVLVGTSMVQNQDVIECNELLDCDMVKLTYSGGTAHNMKIILDLCFSSDNVIDTVYWELDEYQLFSVVDETRFPLPDYMYEETHWRDLEYLLSGDIFYQYALIPLSHSLRGETQSALSTGDKWSDTSVYGKDSVLATYSIPEKRADQPITIYDRAVKDNLDKNILPLIIENPDTEFVFMFVPFSVLYWYNELQNGTFDASMKALEDTIETLLQYDNVSIYYFRNETAITTNLDYYKDYSHYCKEINSYMTTAMANGMCRLTLENYEIELDKFIEFTKEYDYSQIFE